MTKQPTSGIWQAPPEQFEMPAGMPRPLYEGKPVPFTARIEMQVSEDGLFTPYPDFADVDWERMRGCWTTFCCLVCGTTIEDEDEAALIVIDDDGHLRHGEPLDPSLLEVREGGAFCTRCAKLTMAHCPAMRRSATSVIVVGPVRDLECDEKQEKIVRCPESFRLLERKRSGHGCRVAVPSSL